METTELILLYDYYGDLLTSRQRECFELRYYQDLSLGEIGQELGISRQGVYDNLSRTEGQLKKMEEKTGCVRRDRACRKAAEKITAHALKQELEAQGLLAPPRAKGGSARFYVSDSAAGFEEAANLFLGAYRGGTVEQIAIDQY